MANLYFNNVTSLNATSTSLNLTSLAPTTTSATTLNVTNVSTTSLIGTSSTTTNLMINNNTSSTNTSTGALIISGGIGVSGTLNTNGFNFVNRVYGFVNGLGGQTIASGSVTPLTAAYWNGTVTTSGGMSFSGGVFTVPVAGTYIVVTLLITPFINTNGERTSAIRINGTISPTNVSFLCQPTNIRTTILGYCIYSLNAGDTIDTILYQDSGSTMTMVTNFPGIFRVVQI
jgi:hypothetical protein